MQRDDPTLANLPQYSKPEGSPNWPVVREKQPVLFGSMNGSVLVASLAANIALLIGLLSLLFLGQAGFFSSSRSSNGSAPGESATQVPLSSPTVAATLTPSAGSLQVSPTSVTLSCGDGQQIQSVVLVNNGSDRVQWQAQYSQSPDQSGVVASPDHGELRAGTSIVLRIQNNSGGDGGGQGGATEQGTIQFIANNQAAGPLPTVSYTATSCSR